MTGMVVLAVVVAVLAGLMVALDRALAPYVINEEMVNRARLREIGEGE